MPSTSIAALQSHIHNYMALVSRRTASPSPPSPPSSSPPSSHAQAQLALRNFLAVGPAAANSLQVQERRDFTIALLRDLKHLDEVAAARQGTNEQSPTDGASTSKHSYDDDLYRLDILKSLKELSRSPGGSLVQSEPTSLCILLDQVITPPASISRTKSSSSSFTSSSSASGKQTGIGNALTRAWTRHSSKYRSTRQPHAEGDALLPAPSYPAASTSPDQSASAASPSHRLSQSSLSSSSADSLEKRQIPRRRRVGSGGGSGLHSRQPSGPTELQWDITDAALRCINNALYLHETSRKTFAEERIGGGNKAVELLRNPWQTPAEILFLACRLLFFATLFEASFNARAVEEQELVDNLHETLDALNVASARLAQGSRDDGSGPSGNDDQIKAAMAEVLKVIFNVGIYYPRVANDANAAQDKNEDGVGGSGSSNNKLTPLLDPVLRLVLLLPPTRLVSPATNAIGVLLNFPVKPYRRKWLSPVSHAHAHASSTTSASRSKASGQKTSKAKQVAKAIFANNKSNGAGNDTRESSSMSMPPSSRPSSPSPSFVSSTTSAPPSIPPVISSSITPSPSDASTIRQDWEKLSLVDTIPDDTTASSRTSMATATSTPADIPLVAEHVTSFLVCFLDTYFSSESLDPDDCATRNLAKADAVDIEGSAQPLCLLLRNLAADDDELRSVIKRMLLPDNLDRSTAPDRRVDVTGRLIRLMSSVVYTRLAQVAGELLFALCNSDAKTMVNEIGYGPCAGFLMSKGLVGAFPEEQQGGIDPATAATANGTRSTDGPAAHGRTVNPVTGQYDPTPAETARDPINNMTQEEKEEEAERLFGLFDRLNRTGVVKVANPVHEAASSGRFEEIDREEEERTRRGEDAEEQKALREFARYKAQRSKASSGGGGGGEV